MAPSATTTREASASRSSEARAVLAVDGVNEAMEVLPGLRRLSALRLPEEDARRQRNRRNRDSGGCPTPRIRDGYAADGPVRGARGISAIMVPPPVSYLLVGIGR
ncbi:hypothetical protein GCM10010324_53090 [Streptomyces hiroshimensis]|uniref:Uncharacterized protein n=1 Tax=Streptomyces hiroshimensis TaxID=66424 RepID=A0ABQ2Z0M3_9ACTN|nr:hypothetical protein GCM10010324_53090 [Streptomyces hiroshimensis]